MLQARIENLLYIIYLHLFDILITSVSYTKRKSHSQMKFASLIFMLDFSKTQVNLQFKKVNKH